MTTIFSKVAALGGLCALLAGAGQTAFAQGYDNHQGRHSDQGYSRQDRHSDQGYGQNYDQNGGDRRTDQGQYRPDGRGGRGVSQNERRRLVRLHRVYSRDARSGHYRAAEKAHLHAQAIRHDLRTRRQYQHHDVDRGY